MSADGAAARAREHTEQARTRRGPRPDLIPDDARAVAAVDDLGAPVASWGRLGDPPSSDAFPVAGTLVLVTLALLAAGLWTTFLTGDWSPDAKLGLVVAAVLVTLVLVQLVRLLVSAAFARPGPRGDCQFQRGLVHLPATGEPRAFPWTRTRCRAGSVRHVVNGSYRNSTFFCELTRDDGAVLTLGGDSRINPDDQLLCEAVAAEVAGVRLPVARRALAQGRRLDFGEIVLDREGVAVGGDALAWSEVEAIDVAGGKIRIRRRGGLWAWWACDASRVPDLHAVLALADELARTAS